MKSIFYLNPTWESESDTETNHELQGYYATEKEVMIHAREHISNPPQGLRTLSSVYRIDVNKDGSKQEICDLFEGTPVQIIEQDNDVDVDYDYNVIEADYEPVEDRLIIEYVHVTYMNYAHKIVGVRFGNEGETTADLSENPAHVGHIWNKLTDMERGEWEDMDIEDQVDYIFDSLKKTNNSYSSIEEIIKEIV